MRESRIFIPPSEVSIGVPLDVSNNRGKHILPTRSKRKWFKLKEKLVDREELLRDDLEVRTHFDSL